MIPCRRCLLKDLGRDDYFKNIREVIRNISPENRADDATVSKRLEQCRSCENLISGMCRCCGCFVEVRAAVAAAYCPDVHPKW